MSTTEPEAPEVPDVEDDDDDEKEDDDESDSLKEVAEAVLRGEYGKGQEKRLRLAEAGYNHREVDEEVTRILNKS
jgi:hypothetical protein